MYLIGIDAFPISSKIFEERNIGTCGHFTDIHGLNTVEEEQKQYLLSCVQEHRTIYFDCKKETLKENMLNNLFF